MRTGSLSDALAIVRDASDDARLTAVIAPAARVEDIRARVECPVHDVDSAKGLEFDEVILVDPDAIVAESPQGLQDLYVALTRATQGLTVVADGQPESLPPLDPAR